MGNGLRNPIRALSLPAPVQFLRQTENEYKFCASPSVRNPALCGTLHGVPVSPQASANASYAAFLLRGTFFDRLTVYGKVGVDYWRVDGSLGQATLGTSQSANGSSYMYGAGLSFKLVGPLGVIGEYERYQNVGNANTTGRANINAFSLGLVLRF